MRSFSALEVRFLAGVFVALSGCGGKAHESGPDGAQCPPGVPSAAELASTPRADANLELLALKLSSGIVADQVTYDRVVRDVTAIRNSAPELADVGYTPLFDGRSLLLAVDSSTYDAMKAGSYDAWSCLNGPYAAQDFSFVHFGSFIVTFTLRGNYEMTRVAAQYASLPGVNSASPNLQGGDGPTICLTRDGATWHYVFDQASGDCPSGCIDHQYTHFSTSAAGDVTPLGVPSAAEKAQYASEEACR